MIFDFFVLSTFSALHIYGTSLKALKFKTLNYYTNIYIWARSAQRYFMQILSLFPSPHPLPSTQIRTFTSNFRTQKYWVYALHAPLSSFASLHTKVFTHFKIQHMSSKCWLQFLQANLPTNTQPQTNIQNICFFTLVDVEHKLLLLRDRVLLTPTSACVSTYICLYVSKIRIMLLHILQQAYAGLIHECLIFYPSTQINLQM